MPSTKIEKVILKSINNKLSLYLVSLISILVIINNLMNNKYAEVFIFYIIAALIFLYTKNMTIIFLISLIGTFIYSNYKNIIFKEGFKESQENKQDIDNLKMDENDEHYYDSDDSDDFDESEDEEYETMKNQKMYEGYADHRPIGPELQSVIRGATDEYNGYVDFRTGDREYDSNLDTDAKPPANYPSGSKDIATHGGRFMTGEIANTLNNNPIIENMNPFSFKEGQSNRFEDDRFGKKKSITINGAKTPITATKHVIAKNNKQTKELIIVKIFMKHSRKINFRKQKKLNQI